MSDETNVGTETKITAAKNVSKWAIIVACVIFFLQYLCVFVMDLFGKETLNLDKTLVMLLASSVPVIFFSPVYFQLFMDKMVLIFSKKG